jgi:hypothetical protein
MKLPLLRPRSLVFAILAITLFVPAVSLAYKIVCYRGYDVIMCGDGTGFGCLNTSGTQIDCVQENVAADADRLCASHGGFVDIQNTGGQGQVEQIADYQGLLPIPGYTGRGEVNGTVRTPLTAVCESGQTYTCDDERVSCPRSLSELDAQCGPSGKVASLAAYLAFIPTRATRR